MNTAGPRGPWEALLEHAAAHWHPRVVRLLETAPWALAFVLIGLAIRAAYSGSPNP